MPPTPRDENLRAKFMPLIQKKANQLNIISGNAGNGWTIRKTVAPGVKMIYVVRMEHARVEMWIHIGSDFSSQDESSSIHQHFLTKKKEIESAYGGPLNWNHEGRKTAFSIQQDYNDFKLNETNKWDDWVKRMVNDMGNLDDALRPHYLAN